MAFDQTQICSLTAAAAAKSLQSCPTLCDPVDGSPPGSAIPGILQARTLEWAAISFSISEAAKQTSIRTGIDQIALYHLLQPTMLIYGPET